eukprot:1128007-Amphidinium_carterae.1
MGCCVHLVEDLGGQCSLLKVTASRRLCCLTHIPLLGSSRRVCAQSRAGVRTFELCAREAAQIFGGNALVRQGQGPVWKAACSIYAAL